MNVSIVKLTYRRLAPIYDTIFGSVLQPGRKHSVRSLNCKHGQEILEVGVGTGLSLSLYPNTVNVTGIDICPDMLQRARERVQRQQLDHVQALLQMDAQQMAFPSNSFDKVVAMYVIPALADPRTLVAEMQRVCKPNGELIFINHFHSNRPVVGSVERLLMPLWRWVNYRSDLKLEDFLYDSNLEATERLDTNIFGYATMVRCKNYESHELTANESSSFVGELATEEN